MTDVHDALYRDALFDLARTARAFAQAIVVAAERARRTTGDDPLAVIVSGECRAAIQQALALAPGMLPLFTKEDEHGLASDTPNHVPAAQSAADQGG